MMLEKLYLKSYAEFKKGMFTPAQFTRLHGLSPQSAKVILHRLSKSGQALRVERGEYVLLSPESFLKLRMMEKNRGKLHSLAKELFRMFPEFRALLLYGSQVRGDADKYSDYDALLILPKKNVESGEVREILEKKLGIKLHLMIYSGGGYKNAVLSEPYIRFWLAEGIAFDEAGLLRAPLPPIPKIAYEEWLYSAKAYMENAKQAETAGKKAGQYLTALEIIGCIASSLKMEYDFGGVKKRIAEEVGRKALSKMRAGKPMERKNAQKFRDACKRGMLVVAKALKKIGDNEADIYWKGRLSGAVA